MVKECDICGSAYETVTQHMGPYFMDVEWSSDVSVRVRTDNTTSLSTFKVCPDCANNVIDYICDRVVANKLKKSR